MGPFSFFATLLLPPPKQHKANYHSWGIFLELFMRPCNIRRNVRKLLRDDKGKVYQPTHPMLLETFVLLKPCYTHNSDSVFQSNPNTVREDSYPQLLQSITWIYSTVSKGWVRLSAFFICAEHITPVSASLRWQSVPLEWL